jgi:hypothetical protein
MYTYINVTWVLLLIDPVEIWPNPARGVVCARLAYQDGGMAVTLIIVNLLGRHVANLPLPKAAGGTSGSVTLKVPVSAPSGQYLLAVESDGVLQIVPLAIVR